MASIAIGCVLAGVAAFMSRETMSLLIGEAASAEVVVGMRGLIEAEAAKSGAIRRIHTIRTMHLGPQDVLATVRIDFEDTVSAARVETIVGDLEGTIKVRFSERRGRVIDSRVGTCGKRCSRKRDAWSNRNRRPTLTWYSGQAWALPLMRPGRKESLLFSWEHSISPRSVGIDALIWRLQFLRAFSAVDRATETARPSALPWCRG